MLFTHQVLKPFTHIKRNQIKKEIVLNRPPLLQENKIVLRQPKEEDIGIRMAYGISSELARMIGVNQFNTHKFSYSDAKNGMKEFCSSM